MYCALLILRLKLAGIITTEGGRGYWGSPRIFPASSSLESSRLKEEMQKRAVGLRKPPQARWNHHD